MSVISPYLIVVVVGWVVAQGLKYIVTVVKTRDISNFRQLYVSGNMPSAHTTTVVALAALVGLRDGIDSGLFGVAALFSAIVMYDAVMVRRSVGEQGKAIQGLIKEQKSTIPLPRAAKGHTPAEVAVGLLLGIGVGIVVFLATK